MKADDFRLWGVSHFTPEEVRRTGAKLDDVNLFTLAKLEAFRVHEYVDRPIVLLPGGLTTGNHSSPQHANGTAVDIAFYDFEGGPLIPKRLVYAAVEVGFLGIGLYYNGAAISMHLDLGPRVRRWLWVKPHRNDVWTKYDLILDPIELEKEGAVMWPEK